MATMPDDMTWIGENELKDQTKIKISYGNAYCIISKFALPDIECKLETNSKNLPAVEAGNHLPKLQLKDLGYIRNIQSKTLIPIVIELITPNKGSVGGGTYIWIRGKGFSKKPKGNDVQIDGQPCLVFLENNTDIRCITPKQKAGAPPKTVVKIKVNDVEQSWNNDEFNYSLDITPQIISISPKTSSPVKKNTLVVTGINLSTNKSQLTVMTVPLDKKDPTKELPIELYHKCNVTSTIVNNNQNPPLYTVKCRLSGGKSGNYKVKIRKEGVGYSIPKTFGSTDFKYELVITSVSPVKGSNEGGQIISITGRNFSTILNENQVIIGENQDMCIVTEATSTIIKCRTSKQKTAKEGEQTVYVLGRIVEEARCEGTCKYTYDAASTPTVTSVSPLQGVKKSEISIVGTLLTPAATGKVIVTIAEGVQMNSFKTQSSTKVIFDLPEYAAGTYKVRVEVEGLGYAKNSEEFLLENRFVVSGSSPTLGSAGGQNMVIDGNGFTKENIQYVKVGNETCEVEEVTFIEIRCRTYYYGRWNYTRVLKVKAFDTDHTCPKCKLKSLASADTPRITETVEIDTSNTDEIVISIKGEKLKEKPLLDVEGILVPLNQEKYRNVKIYAEVLYTASYVINKFKKVPIGRYRYDYKIDDRGFAISINLLK